MSRCAHHGCACEIGEHVHYCSEFCQRSADGVAVAEALDIVYVRLRARRLCQQARTGRGYSTTP